MNLRRNTQWPPSMYQWVKTGVKYRAGDVGSHFRDVPTRTYPLHTAHLPALVDASDRTRVNVDANSFDTLESGCGCSPNGLHTLEHPGQRYIGKLALVGQGEHSRQLWWGWRMLHPVLLRAAPRHCQDAYHLSQGRSEHRHALRVRQPPPTHHNRV